MKQPFAHFLILLLFMSCLCLGFTEKRTHKKTHVAKHNNKRWKIKTVDGREKGKGDDYQELDVNGERLFHKDTRMATRTLNFKAGNGNWWRPYNHEKKLLIGPAHTFHWLHWHTSCSFSGRNGWKLWGNYEIWFGFFDNGLWRELMVSLVIFSESISSGQSVLIKIWCSVEILKLIWPKKVTLAKLNSTLGSVVPLAMFRNIISAFNLIAYCSQTQGKAVWS